jgi:GNAT superfamily N-acetyltransferase
MGAVPIKLLEISKASVDDLADLQRMAEDVTDSHANLQELDYFPRNFTLQAEGQRLLFIARNAGALCGYCILNFAPRYRPFNLQRIPEIQDLIVCAQMRQQGIATTLIAHCEAFAKAGGYAEIGLGVGLHRGFGPAQRLYAKLGYIPDGQGLNYDREPVSAGEFRPIDDELCIMMTRKL